MKTLQTLGVILLAGFLIVVLSSFVGPRGEKEYSPPRETESRANYRQVAYDAFMEECNYDGTMAVYCRCVFRVLERDHQLEGLMEIAYEYEKTDVFPDELFDAVVECI